MEHERLGETEVTRDPRSEEGADETERDGGDEPLWLPPARALPTAPQIAAITISTTSPGSATVMKRTSVMSC
jgi:hypothetical protein